MTFNQILKVVPSTTYIKIRVDGGEIIQQANVYKAVNKCYNKRTVVMLRPYCITEQEAYYYGISSEMLYVTLK